MTMDDIGFDRGGYWKRTSDLRWYVAERGARPVLQQKWIRINPTGEPEWREIVTFADWAAESPTNSDKLGTLG